MYYDDRGLDRYYGLLELGELGGLWKNVAGRYENEWKENLRKTDTRKPRGVLYSEVMQALDEIAAKYFSMEVN